MAPYLGLDLKLPTSKITNSFSKQASSIQDEPRKIEKLENYIKNLEEERRKIEVFKRELPLCIVLLDDVIGAMKEELEKCRSDEKCKVLEEEVVPNKSKLENGGVKLENDGRENKMNWMSSAQLWSDNNCSSENNNINENYKSNKKNTESGDESRHRPESLGGSFAPFKGLEEEGGKVTEGLPHLSLVSSALTVVAEVARPMERCHLSSNGDGHVSLQSQQGPRKVRRCWSSELHRMFVVALQQLGGAQVATPKQIRELMKVDGLTNDEVKSHLQKYRLHMRRMPSLLSSANQPTVLTGGLWDRQERERTASQHSALKSAMPQGPHQLDVPSSRAISVTCGEDGQSGSYSWK